jgi:hypothetical protein
MAGTADVWHSIAQRILQEASNRLKDCRRQAANYLGGDLDRGTLVRMETVLSGAVQAKC